MVAATDASAEMIVSLEGPNTTTASQSDVGYAVTGVLTRLGHRALARFEPVGSVGIRNQYRRCRGARRRSLRDPSGRSRAGLAR